MLSASQCQYREQNSTMAGDSWPAFQRAVIRGSSTNIRMCNEVIRDSSTNIMMCNEVIRDSVTSIKKCIEIIWEAV